MPKPCKIPSKHKQLIKQKLINGATYNQIAEKYNCSDMSVHRFVKRHNMEYLIVRRTRNQHSKNITSIHPVFKLTFKRGEFIISKPLKEALKLEKDTGVMFGFNNKEQRAFLEIENEIDSFRLRAKINENTLRMSSKDLMRFFIDCFQLDTSKVSSIFKVETTANEKGRFMISQFENE